MFTKFRNEFTVACHLLRDELNVFSDLVYFIGALSILGDGDTVLSLIYLSEALLYFVEGSHHVVQLIVFLLDDF